jgi:hypothetical protein
VVIKKSPSADRAPISSFCRTNLEIQGILGFDDEELVTHRPGFRFAYQLCFVITLLGTVLQSIPILAIAATAAFFAMFPPNHPFDYLYNFTLGRLRNKPKLPPRTRQGRFACAIATAWLATTIYLFATGRMTAGIAMGVALLVPAGLVGFFDVCLPSMLFNAIVYRRLNPRRPTTPPPKVQ